MTLQTMSGRKAPRRPRLGRRALLPASVRGYVER